MGRKSREKKERRERDPSGTGGGAALDLDGQQALDSLVSTTRKMLLDTPIAEMSAVMDPFAMETILFGLVIQDGALREQIAAFFHSLLSGKNDRGWKPTESTPIVIRVDHHPAGYGLIAYVRDEANGWSVLGDATAPAVGPLEGYTEPTGSLAVYTVIQDPASKGVRLRHFSIVTFPKDENEPPLPDLDENGHSRPAPE